MSPPSILIVDDEPDNFDVIEAFLSDQDYRLHYVDSGEGAIAALDVLQPDLILLDVMMPGMDGLELCHRIKTLPDWDTVPIIMVTALTSKQDLARCLAAGADDFVGKPVSRLELGARVRSMLRIRHQYQQLTSLSATLETRVQQRTLELQTLLLEDRLTGLPSRANLLQQVEALLTAGESAFALAYLDCDRFKLVNGAFGYGVGDQLLVAIADRLKTHLRPQDCLARVGADEFCFLLFPLDATFDLTAWIDSILRSLRSPLKTAECEFFITVCVGIALADSTYPQAEALLQAADTAMHKAKFQGKGGYQIFDHDLYLATRDRLTLENDLQRAFAQQEFVVYYQPIIHLDGEKLAGFEALVRWHHPDRGLVPPVEFIPCLEETGLIVRVGMVVLRQACQQLHQWHQQGWPDLKMSVNLSVLQFSSPTLLADIDQILAQTQVNPACLKLEITESAIVENTEAAIDLMEKLRSRHIQISIDDFGTGYSSLGYLHRFPLDNLKIDKSFVGQLEAGNRNYQVVETIITLSNQLNLAVVAEGIETAAQLQWLKQLGCEYGQGYLFSKPLPAADIEAQVLTR